MPDNQNPYLDPNIQPNGYPPMYGPPQGYVDEAAFFAQQGMPPTMPMGEWPQGMPPNQPMYPDAPGNVQPDAYPAEFMNPAGMRSPQDIYANQGGAIPMPGMVGAGAQMGASYPASGASAEAAYPGMQAHYAVDAAQGGYAPVGSSPEMQIPMGANVAENAPGMQPGNVQTAQSPGAGMGVAPAGGASVLPQAVQPVEAAQQHPAQIAQAYQPAAEGASAAFGQQGFDMAGQPTMVIPDLQPHMGMQGATAPGQVQPQVVDTPMQAEYANWQLSAAEAAAVEAAAAGMPQVPQMPQMQGDPAMMQDPLAYQGIDPNVGEPVYAPNGIVYYAQPYDPALATSGRVTLGLVLAILSIIPFIALPPIGIVLALISMSISRKYMDNGGESSKAEIAHMLSIIGLVLSIMVIIFAIVLVAFMYGALYGTDLAYSLMANFNASPLGNLINIPYPY